MSNTSSVVLSRQGSSAAGGDRHRPYPTGAIRVGYGRQSTVDCERLQRPGSDRGPRSFDGVRSGVDRQPVPSVRPGPAEVSAVCDRLLSESQAVTRKTYITTKQRDRRRTTTKISG